MLGSRRTQSPSASPRYDLCLTDDGSYTLFDHHFQATFHSWAGAVTETYHVYLKPLRESLLAQAPAPIRIFEFGFGTGLGWLLTSAWANSTQLPLHYFAVEQFPIPTPVAFELQSSRGIQSAIAASHLPYEILPNQQQIDQLWLRWPPHDFSSPWIFEVSPSSNPGNMRSPQRLEVLLDDATHVSLPNDLDAVFFDPFDRSTSPHIWTSPVLQRIYSALRPGGRMMSYSVSGELQRALTQLGFLVHAVPGPPHGKRQVLLASKPNHPGSPPNPIRSSP